MSNEIKIQKAIRDPQGIWYGPHECNGCGQMIIKKALNQGGLTLDAPHTHHYPNHKWEIHICEPTPKVETISNIISPICYPIEFRPSGIS